MVETIRTNGQTNHHPDKTGLIYKTLNSSTLVTAEERGAPGRKISKERFTIMLCVNSTGQHKLPLIVIGGSKYARCFKNFKLPSVHYRPSNNS